MRIVTSDGVITTRWKGPISGIAGEPTGALLVSVDQGDALVRRLWPDGRSEMVADRNRDRASARESAESTPHGMLCAA